MDGLVLIFAAHQKQVQHATPPRFTSYTFIVHGSLKIRGLYFYIYTCLRYASIREFVWHGDAVYIPTMLEGAI